MERTPALKPLLLLDLDGVLHSAVTGESTEALALVRTARRHCFVALLSNADLARLDLDAEFDAIFNSARLGVAKPDPEIFRRVLAELGHPTAVFCDDTEENVAAARAAGLDGVHVPDTAALRTALAVRGLIPPTVLLILPDRDEAEELAQELLADGWAPCAVHRDMLAGEDDAEDVDWVIELTTAPDGTPASAHRDRLDEVAERHEGFTGEP
ncbi:HAD-IA family hydrolase [Lentzea sp. NPDC004789]